MPRKPHSDVPALNEHEERAWRALARAMLVLPRILDAELEAEENLTVAQYSVLMNLSEASSHSLRMTDLANHVSLSGSGLTRLVERLERKGFVERVPSNDDGRGQLAVLTKTGLAKLRAAWPAHLASVRRHVISHLGDVDLTALASALASIGSETVGPPVTRLV